MEIIKVVYSCGHKEESTYTGSKAKLKGWKEQAEKGKCTACQIEALYAAAPSSRLPRLEGSQDQIKWALEIRQELYAEYRRLYGHLESVRSNRAEKKKLWETIVKVYDLLHNKEATFFIEHSSLVELLEYHKVVNLKRSLMEAPPEDGTYSTLEYEDELFKDREEYKFD